MVGTVISRLSLLASHPCPKTMGGKVHYLQGSHINNGKKELNKQMTGSSLSRNRVSSCVLVGLSLVYVYICVGTLACM